MAIIGPLIRPELRYVGTHHNCVFEGLIAHDEIIHELSKESTPNAQIVRDRLSLEEFFDRINRINRMGTEVEKISHRGTENTEESYCCIFSTISSIL
jgi:hypothetical protein